MHPQGISDGIRVPVLRVGEVVAYALIDEQDAHLLHHGWRMHPVGYAQSSSGVLMHRPG